MVQVEGAKLAATALKAEEILGGLGEVVELLKSRPMLLQKCIVGSLMSFFTSDVADVDLTSKAMKHESWQFTVLDTRNNVRISRLDPSCLYCKGQESH